MHVTRLRPGPCPSDVQGVTIEFDFNLHLGNVCFNVLNDQERSRAFSFRNVSDGIRFASTRAVLREMLASETGIDARSIQLVTSTHGRPSLDPKQSSASIDFNVSHSGGYGLIAWSKVRRVGADIEERREDLFWPELAKIVFGPEDEKRVYATPIPERRALFFDIWVAKEALLKALGTGIGAGFDAFSVVSQSLGVPFVCGNSNVAYDLSSYRAKWLNTLTGYSACIAWSE
jgi:4'-phosphopantetheinyl transferase